MENATKMIQKMRKTGNHGKVRGKRKWWVLAQPPYSPQGNGKQSRDWEDKQDCGRIPNTFT